MHQDCSFCLVCTYANEERVPSMIAFIPLYCMTTFEKHATNIQVQDPKWPARELVVLPSSWLQHCASIGSLSSMQACACKGLKYFLFLSKVRLPYASCRQNLKQEVWILPYASHTHWVVGSNVPLSTYNIDRPSVYARIISACIDGTYPIECIAINYNSRT